ncbi:UvrD-helicase domain-containing protein, partial [Peptoniphilus sp.]|uniref:UvrD-helicase domain-containing protein n=1 Tax=Peptoniphilus sp. TaxID=1971214 RepID=UPI003D8E23EB
MELNETQKLAVNSIDKDINLIAGAGTGKTRVLTSRFVKIILETKNVDRILAITFTKKAAEEMNSRISDELVKMGIDFSEEELNVKTIHSFCQELITENANLLDINPRFEIIEEESADELLSEAIRFVMKNYEQKDFEKYLVDFRSTIFQEEKNFKALYYEFKNKNLDYDDILKKSLEIKESKYTKEDLMEKVLS